MSDDNVVTFDPNRATEEPEPERTPQLPSEEDIRSFLVVSDFIRSLSVSDTAKLEIDEDILRVIVDHEVDAEFINVSESVRSLTVQQGAEIGFDYVIDPIRGDEVTLDDCVNDLTDCFHSLIEWIEAEREKQKLFIDPT